MNADKRRSIKWPHPRLPYGRGVGLEDAADNFAVGEHVEIVIIPLPGRPVR